MRDAIAGQIDEARGLAQVAAALAAVAAMLALLGIYGVTSFVVSQRRLEISVRLAIGARPADVVRLMASDNLRPVAAGLAAGLSSRRCRGARPEARCMA